VLQIDFEENIDTKGANSFSHISTDVIEHLTKKPLRANVDTEMVSSPKDSMYGRQ